MLRGDTDTDLRNVIETLGSEEPLTKTQQLELRQQLEETEKKVKKLQTWFELTQQISDVGSWEMDVKSGEVVWSEETYRILGYDPQEIEPSFEAFMKRVHPDDKAKVEQAHEEALQSGAPYQTVYRLILPVDKVKYVEAQAITYFDDEDQPVLMIGTNQNVTGRERYKNKMEKSLEQKQTLLSEVHHRVKNNLAVVAGILQLQWFQEDDPEIVERLKNSTNRIKTVAGIHEQLYESQEFADIALCKNLKKLGNDLISSMEVATDISIKTDCDKVYLNISQMLPCSLIANEVMTNIVKHAFDGREKGEVLINLTKKSSEITLSIHDDGVGLPPDFDEKANSLGMELIETLTEQLDGHYQFESSSKGTHFNLVFTQE